MKTRSTHVPLCLLIILFFLSNTLHSQKNQELPAICNLPVEEPPLFPCCNNSNCSNEELRKYFEREIDFGSLLSKYRIEGRCFARFEVRLDGSVQFIKVHRSLHPEYDLSIKRAIVKMNMLDDKWQVGRFQDIPQVYYIVHPIDFRLISE